jgi:hypothetical protein
MMRSTTKTLAILAAVGCMFALGGCCKSNDAKTKACSASKSSEECQTCCGGNYSFVGSKPNSCTCY